MLGYHLDADCGQASHVAKIRSKLRARTWALASLKKCGYSEEDLVHIYCTMMRPVVEYCSPAWGSLLTEEQSDSLEKQQIQALKHVFGTQLSARKLLARTESLSVVY